MKNNKASGTDSINAELIKYGGDTAYKVISELINKIWTTEIMPDEWNIGIICPTYKKGDKFNCNNYRGITLLNTTYKIFSSLLANKIKNYAEKFLGDYQCGFRQNRGTVDQLFVVRQIMEKFYEYYIDLYMLFIDFKQAFDSINRKQLYKTMQRFGISAKIIKLTVMTMENTMASINIGGKTGDAFNSTKVSSKVIHYQQCCSILPCIRQSHQLINVEPYLQSQHKFVLLRIIYKLFQEQKIDLCKLLRN